MKMNKDTVRWILTFLFVAALLTAVLYGVFTDSLDNDFKTVFIGAFSLFTGYYVGYQMNKIKGGDDGEG